jgi:4-amino-4-deoxy-L-arabinose transferase-like glycosyltransferase
LAAFILATCLHFTWLARVGRIDMPMTFTIALALGSFHLGQAEASKRWHWLGYTSLALGILLKGPIAIVLPSVACIAVCLERHRLDWRRHWKHLCCTSLWWGVPWMLLLAAPWFIWANDRTQNQLFEVFFWYHNVERGMGGSETLASHPWWFYGPRVIVDLLPWSIVCPFALYVFFRNEETRRDSLARGGLIWFAAITLFLSCMRFKRADYLLPAYPGLAIFLGVCAERQLASLNDASVSRVSRAFVAMLMVNACGWMIYNGWLAADPEKPYRTMAAEIRTQTNRPVIFFRAESHVLHFHVGQPLDTILEWENLAIWAKEPFPVYFVMPEDCARDWPQHLPADTLEVVLRSTDYARGKRDRPLVVLRSRGNSPANP